MRSFSPEGICNSWKMTFLFSAIFLSAAIIINGILVYAAAVKQRTPAGQNADGTINVRVKNAPVWGKKDAPVTIIEFSDFDCPFCKKVYDEVLPQLKSDFIDKGQARFIYKNLPLTIHENAKLKAVAALCAREQKGDAAFYTFHNQLYVNTESAAPVRTLLNSLADADGLNTAAFNSCLNSSQKLSDQVDLDIVDAEAAGANGTPTWFIGKTDPHTDIIRGVRVVGNQPYSVLRLLINQMTE